MKSVMVASKALEELAKLMSSNAHKVTADGSVTDVPLGELAVDDKVLIKSGEKIPADGVIVDGESSANEAMLTDESTPVTKKTGGKVIGGAINGEGSLTIEVKGTGKDSFLPQVIDLVKQAQESRSKTQDLANTAVMWLTLIALSGGAITFFIWLGFMGKDLSFAIERAVTVMVITCPHALGLAVPLVIAVSTALAASNGLLIRNRPAFERARNVQPRELAPGVKTIAELEVLHLLKRICDGDTCTMVIDSRTPAWVEKGVIPGTVTSRGTHLTSASRIRPPCKKFWRTNRTPDGPMNSGIMTTSRRWCCSAMTPGADSHRP